MAKIRVLMFLVHSVLVVLLAVPANAFVSGIGFGIGGAIASREAGRELRETVSRTEAAANALLLKADQLGRERLNQIDTILSETVGGLINQTEEATRRSIEVAIKRIEELEMIIVDDLIAILREAECAIDRSQDQIINQSLRSLFPTLLRGSKRIIRLPYEVIRTDVFGFPYRTREVTIDLNLEQPHDEIFSIIEKSYLESLQSVADNDRAFGIHSAYANLSKLASLTMCKFPGNAARLWAKKHAHYEALVYPWSSVIKLEN